jgi:small-conductance mechanosensitive channel
MSKMETDWKEFLTIVYFGNSIQAYFKAFLLFFFILICVRFFHRFIFVRLKSFVEKTTTEFDDKLLMLLEQLHPRFYDVLAFYLALKSLVLTASFTKVLDSSFFILAVVQIILSSEGLVSYFLTKLLTNKKSKQMSPEASMAFQGLSLSINILLWIIGILLIISNLGFDITSLVTSLGIGGIAIALAVQNILSDIFSSFSIYFDKPFVIGDFIVVGTDMGTVKRIGLKNTRIESLQGEEIIICNKDLTSSRIQNFKQMKKRRIVFTLGLIYETSLEKCKKVPELIKEVFKGLSDAQLDRVNFFRFSDYSLDFEIVYYHLSGDYNAYMATREEINLRIKESFEREEIKFAFPTQSIYLQKTN